MIGLYVLSVYAETPIRLTHLNRGRNRLTHLKGTLSLTTLFFNLVQVSICLQDMYPQEMGWVHAGGVERYCPIAAGSALPTWNTGDVAASLLRANADPSEEANHCGPVMSLSSVAHLLIVIHLICIVLFSVQAVSSAQSVVSSSETHK